MDEDKKSAELRASNRKLFQEEQEKEAELKQKDVEDSFYQKLTDGFDVNVLIVGDSIGAGAGTETDGQQWYTQLQTYLKTVNNGKVSVTNVSMGGNTSYAGYVRTMALNEAVNYDLAIICYGQNDDTDGFSINYESIIRAIRRKYTDCSILSILESSQREYTEKMTIIQSICEHYSIPVVDTIAAFNNSGKAYDDLTVDGIHPNDAGQEIYFETIKAVIDDNVAASTGKMADVDVINADVHKYDNFVWYDASSDFERVDDITFTISTSTAGILGIDYVYEAGFNKVVFIIRKDIEKEFKEVIGDRIAGICSEHNVTVDYAFQDINDIPSALPEGRTKPWGTGQAVLAAKDVLTTPFIVINADDYYGKEGFRAVHEYLVNGGQSCMAGFVLKNTLSDNGGVTRGICKMDAENNLTEVVETKNIVKTAEGAEADEVKLDVDSLVSMNMWGLTPDFLKTLEEGFKEFFEKEVPANPLKAEYLIPTFIGELLSEGKMSVKVLRTNDTWYGMTYKEDVAAVKESFSKMLENGTYKGDLFSDL